jgi:hypothetical protein
LEALMLKPLLIGMTVVLAGNPLTAQAPLSRGCLHGDAESASESARRQQAIDYVTKLNFAESARALLVPRGYRPLNELMNLPPVPAGFAVQFHNDDRSYMVSLKDMRDPCRYATFSDQDMLIYEAVPRTGTGGIIPLGTR